MAKYIAHKYPLHGCACLLEVCYIYINVRGIGDQPSPLYWWCLSNVPVSNSGILIFYSVLRWMCLPKTTNIVMSVNPNPYGLLIFVQTSFLRIRFDRVKQESIILNPFWLTVEWVTLTVNLTTFVHTTTPYNQWCYVVSIRWFVVISPGFTSWDRSLSPLTGVNSRL